MYRTKEKKIQDYTCHYPQNIFFGKKLQKPTNYACYDIFILNFFCYIKDLKLCPP